MTKERSKIESLQIVGKRITSVVSGIGMMRAMTNLKELNLTSNRIVEVACLNDLKGLTTLILNSNRIEDVSSLNLPILTHLSLDRNRIKTISGLRGVKKLEELSLLGN